MILFAACAAGSSTPRPKPEDSATSRQAPPIRVRLRSLAGNRTNLIEVDGAFKLVDLATNERTDSGTSLRRDLPTAGAVIPGPRRLIPEARRFRVAGRRYEGTLRMEPGPVGIDLIVETDLESYLPGVLEAELGSSFPPAALRAQAVASRTYALFKTRVSGGGRSFDVADDQSDQVFRGVPSQSERSLFEAVEATRGMVLLSGGHIIPAYFHSTCGGSTSAAQDVFGGPPNPSLSAVPCRFCEGARFYRWEVSIPLLTASRALGLGKSLRGIEVGRTDRGGRAETFLLLANTTSERKAAEVRMALGPAVLRSTRIRSIKVHGSEIRFEGGGFGHGVGLCQTGARGMALKGAASSDILSHYYAGAQIFRLY